MGKRSVWSLLIVIALIFTGIPAIPVSATVEKELKIESRPSGAEVYLKRGIRELPLGKTPLVHTVEFHSEISVIRMIFRKTGYQSLTIQVKASQNQVVAKLEPLAIVTDPDIHKDAYLGELQKQLNPIINKAVPKLLEKEVQQNFNLAGPIKVAGERGNAFLILPIVVGDLKGNFKGTDNARQEILLKTLWNQLGGSIVIPLAQEMRGYRALKGILLDVRFNELRYIHQVKPTVDTKVEMECVPGNRTQMVLQMRQVPYYRNETWNGVTRQVFAGYRTESQLVPQEVYDPCLYRRPVTKSFVKFDPKGRMAKDQARALYLLPFNALTRKVVPEELYTKLNILLLDSKGKQLKSQGSIKIPSL
ncbi:MAG: hypothetical protein JXC33_04295 [Deltaproteobacteria bacterium]|nr:hypothetical protein [Deltaproteobacteria bacterium]